MKTFVYLWIISSMFVTARLEYFVQDATPFDPACVDDLMIYENGNSTQKKDAGCICGLFLTEQLAKRNNEAMKENPVIQYDNLEKYRCTSVGNKMCMNKCIEMIAKRLPNSAASICKNIDHDCYKEKAYLFFKNCKDKWINTNLVAGREYCCRENIAYNCPTNK